MSYGDQLDAAAGALARLIAALRDPPPGATSRASAAVSRARLYRSLEQQVVALGDVRAGRLPAAGAYPTPHRRPVTSATAVTALAIALRQAAAGTIAANRTSLVDPPAAGPAATALREAYQALQTAGDILISNTGPQIGRSARHRPLSTEGMAVLSGVGRPDNLAALAKLATAAAVMDVRLDQWMRPDDAPAGLQPLLAAADQDTWRTRSGPLHGLALLVAAGGDAQQAPVLGMSAAPPVDDPVRWAHPTSGRDCVEAFDAARTWLNRHGSELTVGQLASTARAALAITHYVGHVHMHLAPPGTEISAALTAAAQPWRGVLDVVTELRSPAFARADRSTLTVAVGGAAAWLRGQLRPDGQWRGPATWASDPADRAAWRDTAGQITARMPDLADLLNQAIGMSRARGGVLAATGRLTSRPRQLVRVAEWGPVSAAHHTYRALGTALSAAATHARELAAAVGVRPRPGLDDARPGRRRTNAPAPSPARLAGQWYPRTDGMTEPSVSTATAARPAAGLPPRPGRGHAR